MQGRAAAKGVALTLAPGAVASSDELEGNGQLFARAVGDLLDNALRHTPVGGQVRVSWGRDGDIVSVAVADMSRPVHI